MVNKLFTDDINPECQLKLFRNNKNRCFIEITYGGDEQDGRMVTLDSDDLCELITELQSIRKEMDLIDEEGK